MTEGPSLSPVQVKQILDEAEKESFFDYVALETMVTLGLRRALLVGQNDPRSEKNPGMLIENLTSDGIWVFEKGGHKVFKKISPELRKKIDEIIGKRTSGPIFPRTTGWVWYRMQHYSEKAGIPFRVKPNMLYDFSEAYKPYLAVVLKNPKFLEQQTGEPPHQTSSKVSGQAQTSAEVRARIVPSVRTFAKPVVVNPSGVILANKTFQPHTFAGPKGEAELEQKIVENYRRILGEGTLYLPIKKLIGSTTKKVTDGLLLDFNDPKEPKFWIVEIELSSHNLQTHVQTQMIGFIQALEDEETLRSLLKSAYDYIWKKTQDEKWIEQFYNPLWEGVSYYSDYQFLDSLLHGKCGLLIIIDKVTPELTAIVKFLSKIRDVSVVEFKTFREDGELIHELSRPVFE